MKTTIWIAIVIVTLASGVMASREFERAHRTQAMLDGTEAKRRRVDAEAAQAAKRIANANRVLDALRATAPVASAVAQKPTTPAKESSATPALHDVLAAHPELRDWFRRDYRFKLRDDYGRFYRVAHLTSEQVDKFEQLMLDAEEEKMDLDATLRTQAPGKSVRESLQAQFNANLRAAQIELLGETGYAQFVEFNQPQVKYLSGIEDRLAVTGLPLTDDQRDQLKRVLITSIRSGAASNRRSNNIDWPRAWQAAQGILSPSQFTVFKAESSWTEFQFLVGDFATREVVKR